MDYISLSSKYNFIMIRTYPTVSNTILNIKTSKIIILINLIKKTFKIGQRTYLDTIYKYIDIIFIFINTIYILATLFITTVTAFNIKSFSSIQKDLIFGFRY